MLFIESKKVPVRNDGNVRNLLARLVQPVAFTSILLLCNEAAAFDLDAGIKAAIEPIKKAINDYYPVAIFASGAIGALLQQQGDLRDRMLGFGKGALAGGLTMMAVKTGLGV